MKTSVMRVVSLAAAAAAGFLFTARAAEKIVASGENLVFDSTTLKLDEYTALTNADTTIVVKNGGVVTVKQGLVESDSKSGTFACNFRLEGENAKLVLLNWYSYKVLAGKISGNGIIRCVSGYNWLSWDEHPHTSIVGDLSDFTGTLELDDMPVAVTGSSDDVVRLACVKSRFNKEPCVGGGLELGANQRLSIGNLDGQLWVRSVDGSGSLDIKDSADSSQVIAVGAVGIRATGSDSPLARLTVTNDAAVTLLGGGFVCVEGKSGMVRVAEAVSHVYRPASGVQFDILSGGTLEFGNAEALAEANPALWLDASKTESLQPLVKDDKTTAEVDGHTVVRRWNDCRASQREIYGLNPYTKVGWGPYQISCFPYVLADACNGLSSISFGGASGDSLRRLPFNKKVDVKWAVMVYSAQNKLKANGEMYLGGYCPDKDMRGAAGNCLAAFEGSEESEWSTESVAYNSNTDPNKYPYRYFSRGWNDVNRVLEFGDIPVWLDGAQIANPTSTGLSGSYQILTIDSRQKDDVNAGVPVRALGTKTDDGYNCGGQVYGELMLFTNALSRVQRLAAEVYLAQKWRVPGFDCTVGNVSVAEGGVFRASELFPYGIGLNSDLTFDFRQGAIANPTVVGGELDAYLPGTITVDFGTERPKAGRYRLIAAGKINRLDPAKWTLKTIPETIKGRTVRLTWETNAAGDCTGAHMDIVSDGLTIMIR